MTMSPYGCIVALMTIKKLDVRTLRKFYNDNENAKKVLDLFAGFGRNVGAVKLDRLAYSLDLNRAEIVGILRILDQIGCGYFIVGRKGHPTRFEFPWFTITSIGRVASSQTDTPDETVAQDTQDAVADDTETSEYEFKVRPGFVAKLRLPSNFTMSERERLESFVRSLHAL